MQVILSFFEVSELVWRYTGKCVLQYLWNPARGRCIYKNNLWRFNSYQELADRSQGHANLRCVDAMQQVRPDAADVGQCTGAPTPRITFSVLKMTATLKHMGEFHVRPHVNSGLHLRNYCIDFDLPSEYFPFIYLSSNFIWSTNQIS